MLDDAPSEIDAAKDFAVYNPENGRILARTWSNAFATDDG
jgi:hypothetical protein